MKSKNLRDLNREMFALVSSYPAASGQLIDFHFKSLFDDYLDAMNGAVGRKMLVFSNSINDLQSMIRRLMLISDLVIFNVNTYSESPLVSKFPVPDELASPVLKVIAPVLDAGTMRQRFLSDAEQLELLMQMTDRSIESKDPESVFGFEWNRPDSNWQRSDFARLLNTPVKNQLGQMSHAVIGLSYKYDSATYDWILGEARPLLLDGYLAFAPFIRASPGPESFEERLQKARLGFARLATEDDKPVLPSGTIHPLALLNVPYLENVPLELLAKAMRDEGESLRAFRRVVDRALEDVSKLEQPSDIKKEITRLQRDLFEDELDRVGRLCQRLSRMKSFAAVSAVVTTAAITAVAAMNVGLPTIVLTGSTGVMTTLRELVQMYEQQKEIKNSPMHIFWRLGHLK